MEASEAINAVSPEVSTRVLALPDHLIQARLNYVWDWWKFHAKQRTDMFNYFLIITGILANAYFNLLKDHHLAVAIGLGVFGMLTSIGFLLLDVRNRKQLERATRVLKTIESRELSDQVWHLELADVGGPRLYRHKFVFRAIEGLVGAGWLLTIIWIFIVSGWL